MVNVKQQKLGATLSNERDSILTRNKLSEASINVLALVGQKSNQCLLDPDKCIQSIHKIPEIAQEQLLSTGSEVYLAKAFELKQTNECKSSQTSLSQKQSHPLSAENKKCLTEQINALNQVIRYSYAYLFASQRPPEHRLFDNRQVQVRDFYNQAIADLYNAFNMLSEHVDVDFTQNIDMGDSRYQIDATLYPNLETTKVEKLISTYNLTFSGLSTVNRRDGFGSEFVLQLEQVQHPQNNSFDLTPLEHPKGIDDNPNILKAKFLPATIIIEPQDCSSVATILHGNHFKIIVADPNHYKTIDIEKKSYPLAANFSAPYGLWLAHNNLGAQAYWSLLDREQNMLMPHLYLLEPFNPDKKIIVMIHGLASSPEAWVAMTNDIMGDEFLRDHYQVWQIFYSTNMPILESRYQIYALLKQTFDSLNQHYPDQKPQDAVLVGHSMGGIISRLLVSNQDFSSEFTQQLDQKNIRQSNQFKKMPALQVRFKMHALNPPFERAIFISSPFRGTDFADRWFTLAARKIIKLPQSFLTATAETVSHSFSGNLTTDYLKQMGKSFLQNGPSDLSKKSGFIQVTKEAPIEKNVKYHVIMGNNTKFSSPDKITDGIVPYYSAHLDGALSEKIIHGGHSIQYSPEAVLELRRILRLHLEELDIH